MSRRQDFNGERAATDGREMRLGDYTLGATLGEGEFGKVKIGWKKETPNHDQVAVKIIRKDRLNSPGRTTKVHREIAILKQLNHPNIVRLHEMVETDHTIGMILEYASGGELFDYILQKRYLNDKQARRLFAQLVSGVGYLHRNGIIHRDLKLENLLLDSQKNIIITDFGFANTFDPMGRRHSDLSHGKVADKAGQQQVEQVQDDLMATSCGSPCYAAPELVVSDGLYSGRKVDVWSCGVILYAMLAGYLPFDDDPDNPDGDNINLLYKYICNTPLIFPQWVSAHARDMLKQILVPDPNKRADLFTVARHSWLMDYRNVVEAITSNVKLSPEEYERIKALQLPVYDLSVRKGAFERPRPVDLSEKLHKAPSQDDGQRQVSKNLEGCKAETDHKALDLAKSHQVQMLRGTQQRKNDEIDRQQRKDEEARQKREQKRRTVQVEYVPPKRSPIQEYFEEEERLKAMSAPAPKQRQSSQATDTSNEASTKGYTSTYVPIKPSPPRAPLPRATSENRVIPPTDVGYDHYRPRPQSQRIVPPSRGSYGQPSSAEVQHSYAQGQISAPKTKPLPNTPDGRDAEGRLTMPPPVEGPRPSQKTARTHKRASTLTNITDKVLNRASSISRRGGKTSVSKPEKAGPPTSSTYQELDGLNQMQQSPQSAQPLAPQAPPKRFSREGLRTSFGLSRKSSDIPSPRNAKRSSFARFSMKPANNNNNDNGTEARATNNNFNNNSTPKYQEDFKPARPFVRKKDPASRVMDWLRRWG